LISPQKWSEFFKVSKRFYSVRIVARGDLRGNTYFMVFDVTMTARSAREVCGSCTFLVGDVTDSFSHHRGAQNDQRQQSQFHMNDHAQLAVLRIGQCRDYALLDVLAPFDEGDGRMNGDRPTMMNKIIFAMNGALCM
jgi:hypothetical protein